MGNKDISSFGISDMADFVVDLISKQVYESVLKKVERPEFKQCRTVNVDELKRGKAVAGTFEPVEVKKVDRAFVPSEIQPGRAVEVNEGVAIEEKPKLETVDANVATKEKPRLEKAEAKEAEEEKKKVIHRDSVLIHRDGDKMEEAIVVEKDNTKVGAETAAAKIATEEKPRLERAEAKEAEEERREVCKVNKASAKGAAKMETAVEVNEVKKVKKVYIPNKKYLNKGKECLDLIKTKHGYILTETFGTSCKKEDLDGLYERLCEIFGEDKGRKGSNYKRIDEIELSENDKGKVSGLLEHSDSSIDLEIFAMQEVKIIKSANEIDFKKRIDIYRDIQGKKKEITDKAAEPDKKPEKGVVNDLHGQEDDKRGVEPQREVKAETTVRADAEINTKDKTKPEVKKVYIPNKEYLSKDIGCLNLIEKTCGYILTEKFEDSCEEKDLDGLYERLAEILGKDKGGKESNYKRIDEIGLSEEDKKKVSTLLERSESIIKLRDFVFQNIKIIKPSGEELKTITDIYYIQSQKEKNATRATTVAEEKKPKAYGNEGQRNTTKTVTEPDKKPEQRAVLEEEKKKEVKRVEDLQAQGDKGQGNGKPAGEPVKKPEVSATGTTPKPTETAASKQGTVKPGWGRAGEDAQERGARMFGELKGRRQVNTGRDENRKENIDSKDDKGQEINETAQGPQAKTEATKKMGEVGKIVSGLNNTGDDKKIVDGLEGFNEKMMKKTKMFNEDNAAEIRASVSRIMSHFKEHLEAGSIYKLKVDSKVVYVDVSHTSSGKLREISDNKVTDIEQYLNNRNSEDHKYMDDNRVRTFLSDHGFNKKRIGRAIREYLLGEREALVNFKNGNEAVHVDMDTGKINDGIVSLPEYKTKRVKSYRDLYGEVGKTSLKSQISTKLELNVNVGSIKGCSIYTPEGIKLEASLENKVYICNGGTQSNQSCNIIFLIDEDYTNEEIKKCESTDDDMFDIVNTADRIGEKKFRKIISKASNKDEIDSFLK